MARSGQIARIMTALRERAQARLQRRAARVGRGPGAVDFLSILLFVGGWVVFAWGMTSSLTDADRLLMAGYSLPFVALALVLSPAWMARLSLLFKRRLGRRMADRGAAAQRNLEELYVQQSVSGKRFAVDRAQFRRLADADTPAAWSLTTSRWLRGVGAAFFWAGFVVLLAAMAWVGWSYEYPRAQDDGASHEVEASAEDMRGLAWGIGLPLAIGVTAVGILVRLAGDATRRVGWQHLEEDEAWLREREEEYLGLRRQAAVR